MPVHDWNRIRAGIFHHFHHDWISTITRSLNSGLLPSEYYALAEQVAGGVWPDVLTLDCVRNVPDRGSRSRGPRGTRASSDASGRGGVALAAARPKVRFTATAEPEAYARKKSHIAVRHVSDDRVVAVLEIVSPGNKSSRHALQSLVEKSLSLLDAGVHLLIVDLFPPTRRDPQGIHGAVWSELTDDEFQLPAEQPLTLVAYSAGPIRQAFIEPVAVGDILPDMPLFLEPELYVPVPLERSYCDAFDAVPERWQDELQSAADA